MKKRYVAPEITVHGDIGRLTLGNPGVGSQDRFLIVWGGYTGIFDPDQLS